jgi:FAD:protein FMN transferase
MMEERLTHQISFTCMGSPAEVIVVGGSTAGGGPIGLANRGVRLLAELEQRWSRFLPQSDISRINGRQFDTVKVHPTTCDVVQHAIEGWRLTEGRFDPTIHAAMVNHGYDRSFRLLDDQYSPTPPSSFASASPGCNGISVDRNTSTVTLRTTAGLDLGGIGKGYAADVVVTALRAAGAAGVVVNVGGDVRVSGESLDGPGWRVRLDDPRIAMDGTDCEYPHLCDVVLTDAAIAVSSTRTRRWATASGLVHHVFDPRTGAPTNSGLVGAVVVAGSGWWAEVLTKAMLVAGRDDALRVLTDLGHGSQGLIADADNTIEGSAGFAPFIRGVGSLNTHSGLNREGVLTDVAG